MVIDILHASLWLSESYFLPPWGFCMHSTLHWCLMSSPSVLQVDRLMELHFKYLEAVQLADKRIEGEKHVRVLPLPPSATNSLHSNLD